MAGAELEHTQDAAIAEEERQPSLAGVTEKGPRARETAQSVKRLLYTHETPVQSPEPL